MLSRKNLKAINTTITLVGETGSGKSSLAKEIHKESQLSAFPFMQINVATLSKNLFESELFGHKKGSFTGANNDKRGLLEEVGKGTLFLDEVQELDLDLQAKLLTVLEENVYRPVGSTVEKKFQGRVILAVNEKLENLVLKKIMRNDFYHRVKVYCFELRPLRESQDLEKEIFTHFDSLKVKYQNFSVFLSNKAKNKLINYSYPGNYRELNGILDYIVLLGRGEIKDYQIPILECETDYSTQNTYGEALGEFEKKYLYRMLKKHHYGINLTAEKIKISKVTLISKIKKYGINIRKLKEESIRAS